MPLSDIEIKKEVKIDPWSENEHRHQTLSYGVTSYGYDVRIADEYKIFTNIDNALVDPKNLSERTFIDRKGKGYCIIPPNSYVLGRSVEWLEIPRDIIAICVGKSTYARCGIIVNVTPLEPEWRGHITIEISNGTSLPVKVYSNEGIMQVLFFRGNPCAKSYEDKKGKYQDQHGIVPALVH